MLDCRLALLPRVYLTAGIREPLRALEPGKIKPKSSTKVTVGFLFPDQIDGINSSM